MVLLPPQAPLADGLAASKPDPAVELRCMFVGKQLFRKGGGLIVRVMSRLRREFPNLRLTLIGDLDLDAGSSKERLSPVEAVSRVSAEERKLTASLIRAGQDWITHHRSLPFDAVLKQMAMSHIGLLPTFSDSFGYSVLEFQAAGCPVISTNSRALSEINDDKVGWIIPVPQNALGEALLSTPEEQATLAQAIERGLEDAITRIAADPSEIAAKGKAALLRVRENHDPDAYSRRLQAIYEDALN